MTTLYEFASNCPFLTAFLAAVWGVTLVGVFEAIFQHPEKKDEEE